MNRPETHDLCPHSRNVSLGDRARERLPILAALLVLAGSLFAAPSAFGHGSMQFPPSRAYACRFLDADQPMCAQAWEANPQALYDWMEINIAAAGDRHQELIPDGRLCSAGREKYAAFDVPTADWPTTEILPDTDGRFTFTFNAWVPHSTLYYRLYLTREGWDPSTPVGWGDLDLVYDSGPWAAVDPVVLRPELPTRTGQHLLYLVWQRDDSTEAFYSCSDVLFGDGTTGNPPPPEPPAADVEVALETTSDWGSGYCATAHVTTTSVARVDWTVEFTLSDTITSAWSADVVQSGSQVTAEGHAWNNAVSAGEPQSFGFCADRSAAPPPSPTPPPPPPSGEGIATPLSTDGREIVDRNGAPVVLRGVNWFGFETETHLAHGLWARDYDDMLGQIAALGYDTIRLPFSLEAIDSSAPVSPGTAGGMNAELVGKTPLEAMDVIIDAAAGHGLSILLDNHSLADDDHTFGLWFGGGYSEADWIERWQMLAARWADRANVIGADVKNEPHGQANWGLGNEYDWRLAAERVGNAIHEVAPHWLIVVEGVEGNAVGQTLPGHWWGGNLEGVATHPVRLSIPNKLVYSPHEYGPGVFEQPWFDPYDPAVLEDRWQRGFNYIATQGIAPILVGEFGGREVGTDTVEGRWQNQFVDFLAREGHSFTYWAWNPNSGDTGGILTDDWVTVDQAKQDMLARLLSGDVPPPPGPTPTPPAPTPTPTPTPPAPTPTPPPTPPAPTPTPTPTPPAPTPVPPVDELDVSFVTTSDWGAGYCTSVTVATAAAAPIDWNVTFTIEGTVRELWSASWSQSGDSVTAEGVHWNDTVAAGRPATFGFCADR